MKYFGNLVTKNNQKPSYENGMKSSLIAKTLKQIAVFKNLDKKINKSSTVQYWSCDNR